MKKNDIQVSVFCMAYNHERFIRETLEGFIRQETDFAYEVIIHDDASTDGTAAIIREYAEHYPEIIKPIYQTENQYSQDVNILCEYLMPRFRGKYAALCEGDDYWIDPFKLQKQFDYMESHPDCSFCFTNALLHDMTTGETRTFIPHGEEDQKHFDPDKTEYDLHDFYLLRFIPTASFFFRTADLEAVRKNLLKSCPAGDLKMRLNLTACGYAHFINEKTCVYRINVPASATTLWQKQDRKDAVRRCEQVIEMLNDLDASTDRKYHDGLLAFMQVNGYWLFTNLSLGEKSRELKKMNLSEIYHSMSLAQKARILLRMSMNTLRL